MNAPLRKLDAHLWDRDPHDWYVEPQWCSQRLFQLESFNGEILDPACGLGRIVESARAAGHVAFGSDLVARSGACGVVRDFLTDAPTCANVVSNPPFKHAQAFASTALSVASRKVALLLPSKWIQGDKRSRWLEKSPLRRVLYLAPRPSMPPGPVIAAGVAPGGGKEDFAWFIWEQGYSGAPEAGWLRREA